MLADRVSRRSLCVIAVSGICAANLVEPHLATVTALCITGFLRMVATAFMWPSIMAWMTETSHRESLSSTLGGYNVTWALGILAGFYVGGWTFEHLGCAAAFHASAALCALTLAVLVFCTPRRDTLHEHADDLDAGEARYFVRQGFILVMCGCFASSLLLYMFPKVVGQAMGQELQSLLHVARLSGQVSAFFILARTRCWHYRAWPMWTALGALGAGLVLTWAASSYAGYAAGFFLVGCGMGTSFTLSVYYAMGLMRQKGLGGGIQETLVGTGSLVGPLYGGAIAAQTTARTSLLAALIPLLLAVPFIRTGRSKGSIAPAAVK